jgi:hypothetical protein
MGAGYTHLSYGERLAIMGGRRLAISGSTAMTAWAGRAGQPIEVPQLATQLTACRGATAA